MSGFTAGAGAFLNATQRDAQFACSPHTERGAASKINAHPKEPRIIYPSGKYIIVQNLDNPKDTFVYRGHSATTTVAKFSHNGFWVASADVSGKVGSKTKTFSIHSICSKYIPYPTMQCAHSGPCLELG